MHYTNEMQHQVRNAQSTTKCTINNEMHHQQRNAPSTTKCTINNEMHSKEEIQKKNETQKLSFGMFGECRLTTIFTKNKRME